MTTNQAILVWQLVPFLTDISVSTILLNRATLFNLQVTGSASFVHSFGSKRRPLKFFLPLLRLGLDHSPKATTFLCYQSWKASLGVRYSLDDQMSLKFNIFKAIFCYFSHLLKLTFFTIFSLESRRAQASISLECETGLTNCIILAPWILAAGVLKRKKRMWNSRRKIYDKWIKGWKFLNTSVIAYNSIEYKASIQRGKF